MLVFGRRLPRWGGLLLVLLHALVAVYYIGFSDERQNAVASIQELPVMAIFLAWFYGARIGRVVELVILLSVVLNQTLKPIIDSIPTLQKLGTNMIALFLVFGLLYWVGMARLVRGQILTIKQNEYVLAARTIGTPSGRILRKHILPNCLSVIIISVALQIPSAIFTESYLSFLGIGVKVPMPSLGSLANDARGAINTYPWQLVFPAVVICLVVLAFNLVGDGLRDAFDPKLKR